MKNWYGKAFADRHNIIVMDINDNLKLSLQKLASVLAKGHKIILFPEGSRTLDGSLGSFREHSPSWQRTQRPNRTRRNQRRLRCTPKKKLFPKLRQEITVTFLEQIKPRETTTTHHHRPGSKSNRIKPRTATTMAPVVDLSRKILISGSFYLADSLVDSSVLLSPCSGRLPWSRW